MEVGTSMIGSIRKLGGLLYGLLEKLICRRAYEVSTLYHDHRVLIEARPYPLGKHVGYRLYWDEYLHGARQNAPIVEVRANRGIQLSKVVISVSASNDKVCYQEEVTLRHVDGRRHRAALPAVPFRYPKIKGNFVYTPYDTFRVELIEIRDDSGKDLLPRSPIVHVTHPMDRLEVAMGKEREYVEKWGRVYNLRFVEMQVTQEAIPILAWRIHRTPFVRNMTEWLQHRRVSKVRFWIKNAIWARPLQRELARHVAEYKEYEANRQKREEAATTRTAEEA